MKEETNERGREREEEKREGKDVGIKAAAHIYLKPSTRVAQAVLDSFIHPGAM